MNTKHLLIVIPMALLVVSTGYPFPGGAAADAPAAAPLSDAALANRLGDALAQHPDYGAGQLVIKASRGHIRLSGALDTPQQAATVLIKAAEDFNVPTLMQIFGHDAEDVMQEAMIRAFRFFDGFSGENPRAWLRKVVRNCAYTLLRQNRACELGTEFDEELHTDPASPGRSFETPEVLLLRSAQQRFLNEAVERLPVEFREVFVLREMEGLSYKEIAETARIPIGTVMSRLSRARRQLQAALGRHEQAPVYAADDAGTSSATKPASSDAGVRAEQQAVSAAEVEKLKLQVAAS